MIRIGFDPLLEAEQHNRELIREVELYRLAHEGLAQDRPRIRGTSRILALIGQEMASLGASLKARYGGEPDGQVSTNTQSNPDGCSS